MGKIGRFVIDQVEPVLGLKDEFLRFQKHVLQANTLEEMKKKLDEMKHGHQNLHEFVGLTSSLLATAAAATLVHPRLGAVHWTVEALWTAVLITAMITAFACCMFYSWSIPLHSLEDKLRFYSGVRGDKIHAWAERARNKPANEVKAGDLGPGAINFWLHIPHILLSIALAMFMMALVLFWLLGWLGPLEGEEREERMDSRNTFLVSLAAFIIPAVLMGVSIYVIEQNDEALIILLDGELGEHSRGRTETQRSDETALTADIEAQQGH